MCKFVLALGCLACIACGQQLQDEPLQRQGGARRKNEPADALSTFLLALAPATAFQPPGAFHGHPAGSTPNANRVDQSMPMMLRNDELTHQRPQRRELLRGAFGALLALSARSAGASVSGGITGLDDKLCKTDSDPFKTIVTCINYGLENGRLRGCNSDEACIATAQDTSNSQYAFPWTSSTSDAPRAWTSVVAAVEDQPDLKIVVREDDKFYLRATAKSKVPPGGTDDVEFLVISGPDSKPLVSFRSSTRQTLYVYPLQQPVDNQQSHIDRLKAIRSRLAFGQESSQSIAGYGALDRTKGDEYNAGNLFGFKLEGGKVDDEGTEDFEAALRAARKSKKKKAEAS